MFKSIYPIEGFFVESKEGLFFDVKGIIHPPQFITAFVRYIPLNLLPSSILESRHTTVRNIRSKSYLKVYDLKERYNILSEHFPDYLKFDESINLLLQGVPITRLKTVFDPRQYFSLYKNTLDEAPLPLAARKFVNALESFGIQDVGVTGSLLVNLHTASSDLDLVVYGIQNGLKTWNVMENLFELPFLERYHSKSIQNLYNFRVKDTLMSVADFTQIEVKKRLQGIILLDNNQRTDFYIRLVKYPTEFKTTRHIITGREEITISGVVADSTDAIFTPCRYVLKDVQINNIKNIESPIPTEILSYRGRFCECAFKNDHIEARGTLEYSSDGKARLMLGSRKDHYLKLISSAS
ncbi:MAG: hypothetical protein ACFFBD_15470 [Candidatus Hodarchaeota archaeon]